MAREHRHDRRRCELERVDIEENGKEEDAVHYYSIGVAQRVPPEDVGVRDPDEVERSETQRERNEEAEIRLAMETRNM